MKTIFFALLLCFMTLATSAADITKEHKVLFEFTSENKEHLTGVLRNAENVRKALGPGTRVTIVAHGPGIALLRKTNKEGEAQMRQLAGVGVIFAACENTLKRKNLSKADLFDFSSTVDSGVAEVVRKQAAGWSYVKSGG
jgi:intracellular sulfur oxidation DsrE/DsrF family protein